jgi:predicted 3-demethylubiquinone-9 3-methyltransferase (glyoxalase superfamily)
VQKITPLLWFDGKAGDAAKFYTSIFKNSKIESISPMSATFKLDGLKSTIGQTPITSDV